jgi:hypothetical protein
MRTVARTGAGARLSTVAVIHWESRPSGRLKKTVSVTPTMANGPWRIGRTGSGKREAAARRGPILPAALPDAQPAPGAQPAPRPFR